MSFLFLCFTNFAKKKNHPRTDQCFFAGDGDKARLDDFLNVLSSDNENVPQLLRFMQSCKRSRAKPHPAFPVAKPAENPLKIPEPGCMELATQPSFVTDHLPLMRDALEYKSTSRRFMSDGSLKQQFDQKGLGDKHMVSNRAMPVLSAAVFSTTPWL